MSDFSNDAHLEERGLPRRTLLQGTAAWRQLKVGSRVVSHDFHMGAQWPPEQIVRVRDKTLYAWTITDELKQGL